MSRSWCRPGQGHWLLTFVWRHLAQGAIWSLQEFSWTLIMQSANRQNKFSRTYLGTFRNILLYVQFCRQNVMQWFSKNSKQSTSLSSSLSSGSSSSSSSSWSFLPLSCCHHHYCEYHCHHRHGQHHHHHRHHHHPHHHHHRHHHHLLTFTLQSRLVGHRPPTDITGRGITEGHWHELMHVLVETKILRNLPEGQTD